MEQFTINEEQKLHNILKSSYFKGALDREKTDTELLMQEELRVVDSSNICMIIAKTEKAKRFLLRYIETEPSKLDFKESKEGDVRLSLEQLEWIIKFLRASTENYSVKLSIKYDFPITFENDTLPK